MYNSVASVKVFGAYDVCRITEINSCKQQRILLGCKIYTEHSLSERTPGNVYIKTFRGCTPALGCIGIWYGIQLHTGASEMKHRRKW